MSLSPEDKQVWQEYMKVEFPYEAPFSEGPRLTGLRIVIPEDIEPYSEDIVMYDLVMWTDEAQLDEDQRSLADEVICGLAGCEDPAAAVRRMEREYDEENNRWFLVLHSPQRGDAYGN